MFTKGQVTLIALLTDCTSFSVIFLSQLRYSQYCWFNLVAKLQASCKKTKTKKMLYILTGLKNNGKVILASATLAAWISNYILFTNLPWPGDSEGTFRSLSQAATCPPVYHTRRRLHTVSLIAKRQAGKLWIPIFIVFGLTRPGIEPESTASVADALSTRPLIGECMI